MRLFATAPIQNRRSKWPRKMIFSQDSECAARSWLEVATVDVFQDRLISKR